MKTLICSFLFFILSTFAYAQVPGMMSYQGFLTNSSDGKPLADGNYTLAFTFYSPASAVLATRTINNVQLSRGLFTVIIGKDATGTNTALPLDIWTAQHSVGISVNGGAELTPRVTLTSTPYSFTSQYANSVNGANITGTVSTAKISGTLPGAQVGSGVSAANITGTLPGAQVGSGISAANISGSLPGTQIGTGISATNVTTGTLPNTVLDADIQDLADGSLTGSKIGSGINAANITTGVLNAPSYIVAGSGIHIGANTAPGANNLLVDGYARLGGTGVSVAGGVASFPSIRVLKVTGTCAAADGTAQVTFTGLAEAKILSINVIVEYTTGDYIHAGYTNTSNLQFNYFYQNNILSIKNITGNSATLAGKPFKVTIIYEE